MVRFWGKWGRPAIRSRLIVGLTLLLFVAAAVTAGPASAHSVLQEASPPPNSTLPSAPERIRLTFNERLEKELYSIYLFNDKGIKVETPAAVLSPDQREVSLQLPKLAEGLYTVSYHIISADGHPVEQSYLLTVGKPTGKTEAVELGHKHPETVYGFRMLHYLFFLMLAGWVLWKPYVPLADEGAAQRYGKWLGYWRNLNVLFVAETLALQTIDAVGEITWRNAADLWLRTAVGWSWIAFLAISLAAYGVLGRRRSIDAAWVAAALLAKTLSGHPLAEIPVWKAALPDFLHLAAGALWAGGIGIVSVLARRHPAELRAFLPRFSRAALYGLIGLAATGSLLVFVYAAKPSDLLYAGWGRWLLVKLGLVALVVVTGARLRRLMRRGQAGDDADARRLSRWLQLDLALMAAIVAIVGIFTYLSPTPANAPLEWKIEEPGVLRTVSITPNVPGAAANQFAVYITQQSGQPPVKLAALKLVSAGRPEVAPIEVPLQRTEASERSVSPGANLAVFMAEGTYLPFPGLWRVELTVRDANDDERVWTREMRVF